MNNILGYCQTGLADQVLGVIHGFDSGGFVCLRDLRLCGASSLEWLSLMMCSFGTLP